MTHSDRIPTTELIEDLQAYAAEQFATDDGEHLLAELAVSAAARMYELERAVDIWRFAANRYWAEAESYRLTAGTNA